MKCPQIILFVAFFLGTFFSAQAIEASNPAFIRAAITTIGEPSATQTNTTIIKKDKSAWVKQAATWIVKKVNDMDQKTLLFVVLAALIGTLGIHRVVAGSSPIIILWYILVALGISLVYVLLNILTGGIFGLFGWAFYWILPLFDLIKVLTKGVSHFEGNNDVFAGFK